MTRLRHLSLAQTNGASSVALVRRIESGESDLDYSAAAFATLAARHARAYLRLREARVQRRLVADVYASLGMKKVRGALGGTYYE